VNDAIEAFFVHLVYSLAVSIRKPLVAAIYQNPRIGAGTERPRRRLPLARDFSR